MARPLKSSFSSLLAILCCGGLAISPLYGQENVPSVVTNAPQTTVPQAKLGSKHKMGLEYSLTAVFPYKVVPKAIDRKSALMLRIAQVDAVPGGFRHELRFMGLRPGNHDLINFLLKEDGTATGALPSQPIVIESLLPELSEMTLSEVTVSPWRRWFGSYKNLLLAAGGAWVVFYIPLLFWKKKKPAVVEVEPEPPPPSLADRIRPFLGPLTYQQIDTESQAQLERLVHAYWREKLELPEGMPASESLATLKASSEAGNSLKLLEAWLHVPPARREQNTARLLAEFSKY